MVAFYAEPLLGSTLRRCGTLSPWLKAGREGEVRYIGEVDASDESMRRMCFKQITAKNDGCGCFAMKRGRQVMGSIA